MEIDIFKRRRCEKCRFWRSFGPSGMNGSCHRHAPFPTVDASPYRPIDTWPKTSRLQWCGQWRRIRFWRLRQFFSIVRALVMRAWSLARRLNGRSRSCRLMQKVK